MNILLLKGFNNYFNRIVKKYTALADYKTNSSAYLDYTNVNFNSNDGIATELIIGNENQQVPTEGSAEIINWEFDGTPDYLICYENEGDPVAPVIKFRWFVMEVERLRSGQYRLALKRDILAEHLNEILSAPCFVEKGFINDTDNALLYNSENSTYNQIKQSETLLQDPTESGWIVGYVAKNFNSTAITPGIISADDADPISYIEEADLPFTVSTSEPSIVIAADATKSDINVMVPMAYVDARYGGWGTAYHQRQQAFTIFNSGSIPMYTNANSATGNNQPYRLIDGRLVTQTIIDHAYTANSFLRGGTFGDIEFSSMASEFALDKVATGQYAIRTASINSNLALNIDMSALENTPTKINILAKKYGADSSDISGGTYGNADRTLYVDINKVIGTSAYTQMKSTYNTRHTWSTLTSHLNGKLSGDLSGYNACIKTNSTNGINNYSGKIVKIGDKFYKMFVNSTNTYHVILRANSNVRMPTYTVNGANTIDVIVDSSSSERAYLNNVIQSFSGVKDDQNTTLFSTSVGYTSGAAFLEILPKYSVTLEEIASELVAMGGTSETFTNTQYSQGTTYDAAFNMFAIPYGRLAFKCANGTATYYTSKSEGIGISRWLATALGTDNLYDLQILPYCPNDNIRNYMSSHTVLDLSAISGRHQVIFRAAPGTSTTDTDSWSPCSFIFTALSSRGTFDIEKTLSIPNTDWGSALNHKLANETQLVRLCSPNWGSMFEFSLAKNNGVTKFNVDYTYKPYQPYIHINPDFKALYGQDWDDSRGLILGGDFSVQSAESAWVSYVNNNKNYQSIFNRQIENLDVNNKISYEQQMFQSQVGLVTGPIGGAAGGAMAGLKSGVPYGAAAGAIAGFAGGTALAAIGGMKDMDWLRRSQAETKDYTKDMYGYQLGNIKARPNSLARTEALNNNNKIWPVIEIYDCTEIEKQNLIDKIRYNGMTIMAIGTLADYSYSEDFNLVYVKGQLIRTESISDDFHLIDTLFQEVNKGFFVIQGV